MARAARRLTLPRPTTFADVAGEGILLAGGARALLLQLAHPAVARGVAEHSSFAEDPVPRLTGTLTYLYVLAFGTEEEIARVAAHVGRAHRGVRAVDGEPPYDAANADLQLWVAATLYETTVLMYERVFGPLPAAAADEVYAQSGRIGTALGMPASAWPEDRSAFAEYWAATVGALVVGPTARRLAHALLRPERAPLWLRAALPLARPVTAALLPDGVRRGYGVRWSAEHQARADRLLGLILAGYRVLPRRIRHLPGRRVLRHFRAETSPAG
jgi:uncharacterized protein (DUF2236 family)